MQLSWKDLMYVLIIIGIVVVWRSCKPVIPENTQIKKPELVPTEQKKDKKGTPYTEIKGTLYTEAQMKHLTDSLRKVLGKGKVVQITTTVTNLDTFLKHDTLLVDTHTGEIYVADSNENLKISYRGNFKADTGSFYLKFTPDTATAVTTVKNPLFGRSTMTTSIYHTNKMFIPSVGSTYMARVPRTILVIGPSIGGGYSTGTGGIQGIVGVTATVPIISIKSKK